MEQPAPFSVPRLQPYLSLMEDSHSHPGSAFWIETADYIYVPYQAHVPQPSTAVPVWLLPSTPPSVIHFFPLFG